MPRDRDHRDFGRKRRYSDVLKDPYKGPQEFMEAGVRGFLILCQPDREEHAIDESIKILRKTCLKLYGGMKPPKPEEATFAKGYVMCDFMRLDDVQTFPHPDAEKEKPVEEEPAKETEEAAAEVTPAEAEGEAKTEDAVAEGEETKTEEVEKPQEEEKGKEDVPKKPRRDGGRHRLMLATRKFQGYRTELRNMMFVKSDIADPVEVLTEAFDLMSKKKPLIADVVNQFLPVQGICDNDYKQLEIMCRRVLDPYFSEQLNFEEAPSFGVLFIDKMCEPGAEVLLEVVRSAIWSINPTAWQASPWTEPDVVIHVEIIGSKIVLCAMPHYMKFRQYSPLAVHELGYGQPEDEDKLVKVLTKSEEDEENRRKKKAAKNKDKAEEKPEEEKNETDQPAEGATEGETVEASEETATEPEPATEAS